MVSLTRQESMTVMKWYECITDDQRRAVYNQIRQQTEQCEKWYASLFQAVIVFVSILLPLSVTCKHTGAARWLLLAAIVLACISLGCGMFYTFVPVRNQARVVQDAISRLKANPMNPGAFGSKYTKFENLIGRVFLVSFILSVLFLVGAVFLAW